MSDVSNVPGPGNFTEAAIFSRVIDNSGQLSDEVATQILSLAISEDDQRRVQVLLEKNSAEGLTVEERQELENLNHVADLLSLWHSRARRALKRQ